MNAHNPSEEQIFEEALRLSSPGERAAYLDKACGGNEPLRQNVEALLRAHDQAGAFLQQPPAALSAKTFVVSAGTIPVSEKPGDKIGRYKLREKLGEGGCGVVYVAEQEEPVRRRVALKIIKLGMDTKQVVARFEAERQALALMDHPNIAKVLDAGATDTGRPYFVMELVRGIRITDYCDKNNLSTEERLKLFIQVCSAIQHAHQKGIIHRDIKPSNILVTLHDGVPVPKVIDFGIAKATSDQRLTDKTVYTAFEQFIGTPAYMSPEQAEMSGLDIDTRSDIYSLGVLLYELLTGRTPFDADTLLKAGLDQMRRIIREQEPQRPSTRLSTLDDADRTAVAQQRRAEPPKLINLIRGDLDWIVMKALEKDRTRRFETVNAFALDAQRHLDDEPVAARPPSHFYRLQKLVRRNKLAFSAGAAIAASLLIGITISSWQAVRAARAERASSAVLEELRRTAPAFAAQARKLTSEEHYDEAIEKLDYAAKLRPDTTEYIDGKADLLQCKLRLKEAAEVYGAVLRITPNDAHAKMNLALCLRLGATTADGAKLPRESLLALLEAMQKEQRPSAQLLPVARLLGKENEFLRETWLARLKDLSITPDKPLEQRLTLRNDGVIELDMSQTAVTDLTPLRELPIQVLRLDETHVRSLDPIRGYPLGRALREIYISGTSVSDISPLADSKNLEVLGVTATGISDLSALRGLRLKRLYLGYDPAPDLSPLHGMHLEALFLNHSPGFRNAQLLAEFRELNQVILPASTTNIEVLRALPKLERIGFNYVEGVGPDKTAQEFWAEWDKNKTGNATYGAKDSETLAMMLDLATALAQQGRFTVAETLQREALAIQRKLLGNDNPDTAWTLNNLAWILREQGNLTEAEGFQRQAVALAKKASKSEQLDVATSLVGLGNILVKEHQPSQAESSYREALAIQRKSLGNENPKVAASLHLLGDVLAFQGKLPEAETIQREALAIQRKLLGNEHPDVGISLGALAWILRDQGKLAEAETTQLESLKLAKMSAGGENVDVASRLAGLAYILKLEKRLVEAEKTYREALALQVKLLGESHPDVTNTLNGLEEIHKALSLVQDKPPVPKTTQ